MPTAKELGLQVGDEVSVPQYQGGKKRRTGKIVSIGPLPQSRSGKDWILVNSPPSHEGRVADYLVGADDTIQVGARYIPTDRRLNEGKGVKAAQIFSIDDRFFARAGDIPSDSLWFYKILNESIFAQIAKPLYRSEQNLIRQGHREKVRLRYIIRKFKRINRKRS